MSHQYSDLSPQDQQELFVKKYSAIIEQFFSHGKKALSAIENEQDAMSVFCCLSSYGYRFFNVFTDKQGIKKLPKADFDKRIKHSLQPQTTAYEALAPLREAVLFLLNSGPIEQEPEAEPETLEHNCSSEEGTKSYINCLLCQQQGDNAMKYIMLKA